MTSGVAAARTSLDPLGAGALLLAVLVVCVGAGALIGSIAGSVGIGVAIGALIGIPASILVVYRTYRGAF
jgi:F0F1-type ATP synthase assembly protein I